jgi:uncharacterized protein (DUF433 family)
MTAGTIVGLLAAGKTAADILAAYPYLEPDDINAALAYAAWRAGKSNFPFRPSCAPGALPPRARRA